MAGRIRTIKPEVLEDEEACALTDTAWRLWVGSWVLADDHGRFRAAARFLASNIWQDTGRMGDVDKALVELAHKGFIRRYKVGGQVYAQIKEKGWKTHQKIHNPGQPRVPVPTDDCFIDGERLSGRVADLNFNKNDDLEEVSRDVSEVLELPPRNYEDLEVSQPSPSLARTRALRSARPPTSDLRPPTSDQQTKGQEATEVDQDPGSPATAVFNAYIEGWRRHVGKGAEPKLTDARRRLVRTRLKEGHSMETLKSAASGLWVSTFHVENGHTSFDLAMRDSKHVEMFSTVKQKPTGSRAPWLPPVQPGGNSTAKHVTGENPDLTRLDKDTDERPF
jgi:hypothetical protein